MFAGTVAKIIEGTENRQSQPLFTPSMFLVIISSRHSRPVFVGSRAFNPLHKVDDLLHETQKVFWGLLCPPLLAWRPFYIVPSLWSKLWTPLLKFDKYNGTVYINISIRNKVRGHDLSGYCAWLNIRIDCAVVVLITTPCIPLNSPMEQVGPNITSTSWLSSISRVANVPFLVEQSIRVYTMLNHNIIVNMVNIHNYHCHHYHQQHCVIDQNQQRPEVEKFGQ